MARGRRSGIGRPTVEKPFALKIAGNDDCSYTKYYPTLEAARAELDLFLSDQPLNFPCTFKRTTLNPN